MPAALAAAVLALRAAQLPDLPDPEVGTDPWPYVWLFLAGFGLGVVGYLFSSRTVMAVGVLAIFMATIVLPLLAALLR